MFAEMDARRAPREAQRGCTTPGLEVIDAGFFPTASAPRAALTTSSPAPSAIGSAIDDISAAAGGRQHGKIRGMCGGAGDRPGEAAENSRRGVARRAASARGCEERALREEALKPWVPAQSKAKRSLVYGFLLSVTDISVGEMYFTHPRVKPQSMCSPCSPSIPHLAANFGHKAS